MITCLSDCVPILMQNRLLNIDMLEAIRRGRATLVYADADAVLLKLDVGWLHQLYAATPETARRAIRDVCQMEDCVARPVCAREAVEEKFGLTHANECYQTAYLSSVPLFEPAGFDIRTLTAADLPVVHAHYHMGGPGYLEERVASGAMIGCYIDGALAGFAGEHDEGSCGMLEVLPAYRRRGVASALEARLINRVLARGFTPFGQVFSDNDASLSLQRHAGLAISDGLVYWMFEEPEDKPEA